MASRAVRQPSSLSGGRMEAGRRGAARGGLPGSQRLTAAAVFAAATGIAGLGAARPDLTARLGRAVLPVMTRLLRGSSSGPQQPSARDKGKLKLALIINEMVTNAQGDEKQQVRNAAFGFVPGADWHNKNVLTKRLPAVKDMGPAQLVTLLSQAGVGVVPRLHLSYNTLQPENGSWEMLRELVTLDIIQVREYYRLELCSLIFNLYLSVQATLGLSRLMMPQLQATIVRQANKTKSLVEVPVGIDVYQDLLLPEERAMALSDALRRHIDSAAEVAHLMYLREHQRAHKIEMRRFNMMQGYNDRTLPVPHLYEVLW